MGACDYLYPFQLFSPMTEKKKFFFYIYIKKKKMTENID